MHDLKSNATSFKTKTVFFLIHSSRHVNGKVITRLSMLATLF